MPTWSYHLSIHPPIDLVYLNYRFYLRGAIQSVVSADAMQFSVQPASVHPLMLSTYPPLVNSWHLGPVTKHPQAQQETSERWEI